MRSPATLQDCVAPDEESGSHHRINRIRPDERKPTMKTTKSSHIVRHRGTAIPSYFLGRDRDRWTAALAPKPAFELGRAA
jgi:hypothetical protein